MRHTSRIIVKTVVGLPTLDKRGKTPGIIMDPAIINPFGRNTDYSKVTHTIYEKLVQYAAYPDISMGQCTNVSNTGATLIKFFNITSTDTQAVLWNLPSEKNIIVSIPGTASDRDWLTDFDFFLTNYASPGVVCPGGCQVHSGFVGAWNSLAPELMPALESALEANPDYRTVITGHSLGGALAQLAFASLSNAKYKVVGAYTYGQPRVGNQAFADYIDSLAGASYNKTGIFYRVTHFNDGVPLLPPQILGFTHSLTEFWESTNKSQECTTYQCYGQESSECVDSAGGFGVNNAHVTYAGLQSSCD
ncbi:feruloyl esterase A precursor [Talaromyces proteolyticus]|uniref:Feruloyl esterase A n=1 Tax=Talaromyces proteolyticus TaxID=1131652 RepID=A0AAD4PV33_9EURO|nr:feruloyl esterase A precursor [Talaromyces proteolyticus]KAH8689923.1 feruloyl esterase A precursor [Talaromyces proteolyticus]